MSSTLVATCFSGTARAATARRRTTSRCCSGRRATPRRSGRTRSARSSGVARSCARSTYTSAKFRTIADFSGLAQSAVRSARGRGMLGCALRRLFTCDRSSRTFFFVEACAEPIWSTTRGMRTWSTRSSLASSVNPSAVSALSSAATSSASVGVEDAIADALRLRSVTLAGRSARRRGTQNGRHPDPALACGAHALEARRAAIDGERRVRSRVEERGTTEPSGRARGFGSAEGEDFAPRSSVVIRRR